MKSRTGLAVLALLFVVLASWYASITPYRSAGVLLGQRSAESKDIGAPDERQHVNYVKYVRDNHAFPVFNPQDPNLYESYQSHQTPLFYLLAQPFYGEDGRAIRYLNVFIGLWTLFGLFKLGAWASGKEEFGLACASVALLPMHLALCGAVSNDPLLICLMTWSLAFMARYWDGFECWKPAAIIGGLIGASFLTKSNALAIYPVVLLYVALLLKSKNLKLSYAAVICGLPLLIALPWWARNSSLYGDPLGLKVFGQAFTGTAQAADFIAALGPFGYWADWVTWWTSRSFIGAFGYMDIFLPGNEYLVIIAALFVICCGWIVNAREKDRILHPRVGILAAALALTVGVLFIKFNMQYFQAQARYLYPALGAVGLLIGGGAYGVHKKWGWAILGGFLLLLNLQILAWLPSEFQRRIDAPVTSIDSAPSKEM